MTDSPNRRPAKPFEPPPWERAQFDELARQREEAEKERELNAALAALAAPVPDQAAPEVSDGSASPVAEESAAQPEARAEASGEGPQVAAPAQQQAVSEGEAGPTGPPASELDDKVVEAMLVQLRAEEPVHDDSLWKVSMGLSAFSALIGAVLFVWGLAALMKTGSSAAGMIGGSILLAFGGMFVGIGAWMAARGLKERGVL